MALLIVYLLSIMKLSKKFLMKVVWTELMPILKQLFLKFKNEKIRGSSTYSKIICRVYKAMLNDLNNISIPINTNIH